MAPVIPKPDPQDPGAGTQERQGRQPTQEPKRRALSSTLCFSLRSLRAPNPATKNVAAVNSTSVAGSYLTSWEFFSLMDKLAGPTTAGAGASQSRYRSVKACRPSEKPKFTAWLASLLADQLWCPMVPNNAVQHLRRRVMAVSKRRFPLGLQNI